MSKHHLHQLLSRYQSGNCSEQEKRLVEQWFLLLDDGHTAYADQDNQRIEDKIWNAIQEKQNEESDREELQPTLPFVWRWAAAAAVLLFVLWGGYQFRRNTINRHHTEVAFQPPAGLLSRVNNSDKPIDFRLPDSSEVSLLPKSSIQFPSVFKNNKREVFLNGKAFFHVARNISKPFFVHTGEVVTKVLGTSFRVDSNEDKRVLEVSVLTGKVSVFRRTDNEAARDDHQGNGVVLTPNQRVLYSSESRVFTTGLVDQPVMPASFEKEFVFDDTSLNKVFNVFEKAYGIEIILENENLKDCLFTADIGRQPMFTKLDLICSSVNADYEVRGTRILISGKGCRTK